MTEDAPGAGLMIRVRGQVQGVGFRPFVWQLAQEHGVRGAVLNDAEGVLIRALGADRAFLTALTAEAPPLSRVDAVETRPFAFATEPTGFEIVASEGQGAETRVPPDAATCTACLAEICDPDDRRACYPFANCTHCGPRFTILDGLPYDRAHTSMAAFEMCAACLAEYRDPADRRFHAQPIACPDCGPRLWMEDPASGAVTGGPDVIAAAVDAIKAGMILAIKGLGGFHLACDATQAAAIARLRARKNRPTNPLALMGDMEMIEAHAVISEASRARLSDPAAPIVLLDKGDTPTLPDALAPGQRALGWMLPYTPLHHLLIQAVGRPLVMTSDNLSGEPQVVENDQARENLSGIADRLVLHDRGIRRRLDDSVERDTAHGPMILRRGRGRVPGTLPLPPGFEDAPQGLAVGGQMKAAICLIKGGQALLGHHLGDLDNRLCFDAFRKAVTDYTALFDHQPKQIACDMHPGYRASRWAKNAARSQGLHLTEVPHHHAHLAACLAEHRWPLDGGPVAGIILDGLGLGPDGTIWGGEVLLGDYKGFERRAWLSPAPLPGGDAAGREPWRNALARLDQSGAPHVADALFADKPRGILRQAMAQGINAPRSSSAGRLFDAYAALLGLAPDRQSYEGEAAMALEAAAQAASHRPAPLILPCVEGVIDPAPLFLEATTGASPQARAYLFHATLAQAFVAQARDLVESGAARAVVLSGGCFQNVLLLELCIQALGDIPTLIHTRVPANDGGLALGQAVIAAATRL